jgi:shikimate kinase
MIQSLIRLIGPGGAGKSTAGALLADRLDWQYVDLDHYFLEKSGDIAEFIERHGYAAYARQNVGYYLAICRQTSKPTVFVLSSGFMSYPDNVDSRYAAIKSEIESHSLSIALLPSFDIEKCVKIIISRQLQRSYLRANAISEEKRIRNRFPLFMAMQCKRVLSDSAPDQVVLELESIVKFNTTLFGRTSISRQVRSN